MENLDLQAKDAENKVEELKGQLKNENLEEGFNSMSFYLKRKGGFIDTMLLSVEHGRLTEEGWKPYIRVRVGSSKSPWYGEQADTFYQLCSMVEVVNFETAESAVKVANQLMDSWNEFSSLYPNEKQPVGEIEYETRKNCLFTIIEEAVRE